MAPVKKEPFRIQLLKAKFDRYWRMSHLAWCTRCPFSSWIKFCHTFSVTLKMTPQRLAHICWQSCCLQKISMKCKVTKYNQQWDNEMFGFGVNNRKSSTISDFVSIKLLVTSHLISSNSVIIVNKIFLIHWRQTPNQYSNVTYYWTILHELAVFWESVSSKGLRLPSGHLKMTPSYGSCTEIQKGDGI